MRIGFNVEQLFYRAPGGTGRYSARLASTLAAQFSSDTVVPFSAWHAGEEIASVFRRSELKNANLAPLARLPLPRPVLFDAWHYLGWPDLGTFSPDLRSADVVHVPFPAVPPVRQPLVVTVFDAGFAVMPEAYPRRGLRFHTRALQLAARRAGAVLTATRAAAAEIAAFSPVPPEQLRVIPLGVDHQRPDPAQVQEALSRHQLAGTPYILWVGSLEPRKGLATLIKAFAKLVKAAALPHRLVLVGPLGWLHEGLVPDEERALLGERLRTLGHVDEADLRSLYAGASVLALPSQHEGFGLPVLEAMVQGTPVVCSDIAALAEVSGGAARLVPPGEVDLWAEALAELATDEASRAVLVEAGYERAAQFSWERMAAQTHAVYEELV